MKVDIPAKKSYFIKRPIRMFHKKGGSAMKFAWIRRMSLRRQILWGTQLFTAVVSLLVGLVLFYVSDANIRSNTLRSVEFNLQQMATSVQTSVETANNLLNWASTDSTLRRYLSVDTLDGLLTSSAYNTFQDRYLSSQLQTRITRFFITNGTDRFLQQGSLSSSVALNAQTLPLFEGFPAGQLSFAQDPLLATHPDCLVMVREIRSNRVNVGWVSLGLDTAVITGAAEYPQNLVEKMRAAGLDGDAIDALGLAEQAGSSKAVNLVLLGRLRVNFFINTLASGFVLAFCAYAFLALGFPINIQVVITGSIMVLVPGLVFTNFMSDLLTGDIVAGLSTFTRAVLTAGAIALGTGAALALCLDLWTLSGGAVPVHSHAPVLYCLFAFLGCLGFCFPYNVQGLGGFLCCLGGALGWAVYLLTRSLTGDPVYLPTLFAAMAIAVYAEIMARLRKCPTTSYLVISYFPLVPGFTIYQAMDYGIQGNTQLFLETFIRTFGIAGCIALGALVVSTAMRIFQHYGKER